MNDHKDEDVLDRVDAVDAVDDRGVEIFFALNSLHEIFLTVGGFE